MAIFTLSDPHLSIGCEKPMDIFGQHWLDHTERLKANWQAIVSPEDTVVIGGDISWAMQLIEALPDLIFLNSLPGRKILMRGNHDYWWTSIRKLEHLTNAHHLDTISFLRNNAYRVENSVICGTRGWLLPDDPEFSSSDHKIFDRECGRLQLTLKAAKQVKEPGDRLIVILHYPPIGRNRAPNSLTAQLSEHVVDLCVYGHVHGEAAKYCLQGMYETVDYKLASADYLGFKPLRL